MFGYVAIGSVGKRTGLQSIEACAGVWENRWFSGYEEGS